MDCCLLRMYQSSQSDNDLKWRGWWTGMWPGASFKKIFYKLRETSVPMIDVHPGYKSFTAEMNGEMTVRWWRSWRMKFFFVLSKFSTLLWKEAVSLQMLLYPNICEDSRCVQHGKWCMVHGVKQTKAVGALNGLQVILDLFIMGHTFCHLVWICSVLRMLCCCFAWGVCGFSCVFCLLMCESGMQQQSPRQFSVGYNSSIRNKQMPHICISN